MNINQDLAININHANVFFKDKEVLHDICLQIPRGSKYFILGANGSGKTTLVKTILGYKWAYYGAKVEILGKEFGRCDINELRKSIAWVSPFIQKEIECGTTGVDMVLSGKTGTLGFFRRATDDELETVEHLLRDLNGLHLANKDISEMSSGEQMKILIARALISEPELMIFDEPSVFLDIKEREFFLKIIDKLATTRKDLTIIFISQRIEDILPAFEYGMILKDGRIETEGKRDEILNTQTLQKAFGVNINVIKTDNGRLWSVVE